MHRKVAVATVAALALVAVGCGESERTTTLEKTALVRRVELACRAAAATSNRLSETRRVTDPIMVLNTSQRLLARRIERLSASGDAKDDFDMYKDGVRQRLALIERVVAAPRANRPRVLRAVEETAADTGRRIETAVRNLGLDGCG
jgi:hypothetical protein